jgi:hypothetical protein
VTRQKPRPSPYAWLWAELARRFGAETAAEIKADYLEQHKARQRAIWDTPSPPQPRANYTKRGKR